MTDPASRPIVDTLRSGLRWLKRFEDAMDFSMDEYLLGRIKALEQIVCAPEARIDGLSADRPPHPQVDTVGALTPRKLNAH